MNLTLGLSESPAVFGAARSGGVEKSVARFQQLMAEPDSPIRAIRHQPAREGEFAEIPESLAPVVRQMLESRGIPRLYTHQAEALHLSPRRQECRGGHADRQRQNAVLQPPGPASPRRKILKRARSTCFLRKLWPKISCTNSKRLWTRWAPRFAPSPTTATHRRTLAAPSESGPTWS